MEENELLNKISISLKGHDFCLPATLLAQKLKNLSKDNCDFEALFSYQAHYWGGQYPLECFATSEFTKKILADVQSGNYIFSLCMTEPTGGSSPWKMNTKLQEKNGEFVLNGEKTYITNLMFADYLTVYASDLNQNKHFILILNKKRKGITCSPLSPRGLEKVGLGKVIFQNVLVSEQDFLCAPEFTRAVFQESMNGERIMLMAICLGRMEYVYEETLYYCKKRKLTGHDLVLEKLSEMHLALFNSQNILIKSAQSLEERKNTVLLSAMCKLQISTYYEKVVYLAKDLYAAAGLEQDHFLTKDLLWAQASKIYSGTPEIMKKIIGKIL